MEKTGELVSIIVPVYQVKEYLDSCVQSLRSQTYRDIEIILIDDGSADGSGRLCDQYAKEDVRIKVLHQKNKGLSGARNEGLRLAAGEYIAFVDSDDVVSPDFIEELYTIMKEYHAQIAVCSYEKGNRAVFEHGNGRKDKKYCINAKKMLVQWHGKRKKVETVVWNKLYHRSVFGCETDIFPEGKLHEDVYVSHLLVNNAERIAVTSRRLYFYRIRTGSIKMSRVTKESVKQNLDAQRTRMDFFRKEGMRGSYRRLLLGFWLHVIMYRWKLHKRAV